MKMHLLAAATVVALSASSSAALAQDTTSDKGKTSYALGYRAGMDIGRITGAGEPVDMETVIMALRHAAARQDPAVPADQLGAAMQQLQMRMASKAKAELDARAADNLAKGEAFLAQHRGQPGVTVLPSGVQYRVIEAGNGARPTGANQISVEFKSTLPDGTVLSDTGVPSEGQPAGPVTLRLSEIPLPGLREALQMMPAGARWEVALPGSQAHGTTVDRAGEMANQVVVFNIQLVTVGPAVAAPGG